MTRPQYHMIWSYQYMVIYIAISQILLDTLITLSGVQPWNQAEVIKDIIQGYKPHNRIGYFVSDNASNNSTAIDLLIAYFLPHLTPKQRLGRRLRCLGHVIQLSAKAFLHGTEFDTFEKKAETFKKQSSLLKELHLWRKRGQSVSFTTS